MGNKPFSDADIKRRLLASANVDRKALTDAKSYSEFFRAQDATFSTERGYGRVLYSAYELDVVNILLTNATDAGKMPFRELSKLLKGLTEVRGGESCQVFAPLRQAVDAYIAYGKHGIALETMARGGSMEYVESVIAAELAAETTAEAFRDIALHELFILAGGSGRASERALNAGTSFTALRKRYRVKLASTNFELLDWQHGLLKTMKQLQQSTKPIYTSFADMQQQMALAARSR